MKGHQSAYDKVNRLHNVSLAVCTSFQGLPGQGDQCTLTLGQDDIVSPLCEDNNAASLRVLLGKSSGLKGYLLNVSQFETLHFRKLGCLLQEEHFVLNHTLLKYTAPATV